MVLLLGDLGAGKTAFAQFVAAELGIEEPVTSPTFAIMHTYECGPFAPVSVFAHLDAYRLGADADTSYLGLDELLADGAAALIEWGNLVEGEFPGALRLEFRSDDPIAPSSRRICVSGRDLDVVNELALRSGLIRC